MTEGSRHRKIEEKHRVEFNEDERTAIDGLDEPISIILEQLRANIELGKYQLVVGDDASGRSRVSEKFLANFPTNYTYVRAQ